MCKLHTLGAYPRVVILNYCSSIFVVLQDVVKPWDSRCPTTPFAVLFESHCLLN